MWPPEREHDGDRPDGCQFRLWQKYLEDKITRPLDPIRLPKRPVIFETTGQMAGEPDIFGVIADSLPNSWGRYVINRRYGEQLFPSG